jgi:hypothetical protein
LQLALHPWVRDCPAAEAILPGAAAVGTQSHTHTTQLSRFTSPPPATPSPPLSQAVAKLAQAAPRFFSGDEDGGLDRLACDAAYYGYHRRGARQALHIRHAPGGLGHHAVPPARTTSATTARREKDGEKEKGREEEEDNPLARLYPEMHARASAASAELHHVAAGCAAMLQEGLEWGAGYRWSLLAADADDDGGQKSQSQREVDVSSQPRGQGTAGLASDVSAPPDPPPPPPPPPRVLSDVMDPPPPPCTAPDVHPVQRGVEQEEEEEEETPSTTTTTTSTSPSYLSIFRYQPPGPPGHSRRRARGEESPGGSDDGGSYGGGGDGGGDTGGGDADGGEREDDKATKTRRKRKKKKRRRRGGGEEEGEELLQLRTTEDEGLERVLMDDHVDDSLLTVIPFTHPGLRVWDAEYHAWVGPEEDLSIPRHEHDEDGGGAGGGGGGGGRCAVVMVGETLEFLTGGRLPATRHKVMHREVRAAGSRGVTDVSSLPSGATQSIRLSFPFLLRPRDDATLRPGVYGGVVGEGVSAKGGGAPVLAGDFIDGIKRARSSAVYLAPDAGGG